MTKTNPAWTLGVPAAAAGVLALAFVFSHPAVRAFAAGVLMLAVFAAVHHAEVIAHRIGEPFGTLVLAVAVTTSRASRCAAPARRWPFSVHSP